MPKEKLPLPFTISFFVKDAPKAISTTFHLPKPPTDGAVSNVFIDLLRYNNSNNNEKKRRKRDSLTNNQKTKRQRAYEGIADMITKAKIEIDKIDSWVVEGQQQQEKRDFAHSRLPKHWRPIGWSPADQDYGIIEIFLEHCRYLHYLLLLLLFF